MDVYLSDDVNQAVKLMSEKITTILDIMAPMRTVQVRTNYAPWLSQATKDLMSERDKLQERAAQSKDSEDWKKFKSLRNKINSRLGSEERSWQRSRISECGENPSKVWKNVKDIINWKTSGAPNQLFHNGVLHNKPAEVADCQNHFFINKVQLIRDEMPAPISDPLSKLRELMASRKCSFSLHTVHPDEVSKLISDLKNTNSVGLDLIDTRIIKLIQPEILPALTHVINLSISKQEFPAFWKRSKIIPLHKKEDILNPKNYRPVAIIPIFSKILERVIFNQVIRYISENNLLHPNHHSYRQHHNTTTALIQMYDTWMRAVDSGELAGVCLLDMSAAFDIVDHGLLIEKLKLYGFNDDAVGWLKSYLSDRKQCVSIDGCLSRLLEVPTGVPQGSILGPILYILFTNELPDTVQDHHVQDGAVEVHQQQRVEEEDAPPYTMSCTVCGSVCCYADDTTYSCSSKDPEELSRKLSSKYMVVSEYMVNNRLKLNDDKTHLMVMTTSQFRKRNPNLHVEIRTPTEIIEPTVTEKLLGGSVHQDMKWAEHLLDGDSSLVKGLTTRLSALKKVGKIASFRNRKMIANGLIMSKLSYLIPLWAGCETYLMQALQRVQNKAARTVTRSALSTAGHLAQCGWLSVHQLSVYQTCILVHKVLASRSPQYLFNMFTMDYNCNTRQAARMEIRQDKDTPELELTKDSFRWRATKEYNKIPAEIRTISSIHLFKTRLWRWIITDVPIG